MTPSYLQKTATVLSLAALLSICFGHIDTASAEQSVPYQGVELFEEISKTEKTSPPFFSEDEWARMRSSYGFSFDYKDVHGLKVPVVNGNGLMGTSYMFSTFSLKQNDWDARIMAQQGINWLRANTRSVVDEGADPAEPDLWNQKLAIWKRYGIGTFIDSFSIKGYEPIMSRIYAAQGRELNPDYLKHSTGIEFADRYGDYFDPGYCSAVADMFADFAAAFKPAGNNIAYHPFDEARYPVSVNTAGSRLHWQRFVRDLYADETPGSDTNGDGMTFNSSYGKSFGKWEDVEQFAELETSEDKSKSRLDLTWKEMSFAEFLQAMAGRVKKVDPEAFWVHSYVLTDGISAIASQPDINALGVGNYSNYARSGFYAAASHFYGKPAVASHINTYKGNYYAVRSIGVGSLPYFNGMMWWHFTNGCSDKLAGIDYGSNYGLVNWWTVNDQYPINWGAKINKVTEYDGKFLVIPQLAPFINRFSSVPEENREGILWLDAPTEYLVRDNHYVAQQALAFGKTKPNLSRYKAIIYAPDQPCISGKVRKSLEAYVRQGGTVILSPYTVGRGKTILGEDNSVAWWRGLKLERDYPGSTLLYADNFQTKEKWEKDRHSLEGTCDLWRGMDDNLGAYPYGTEGTFTYKFNIDKKFIAVRIYDEHAAWAGKDRVRMWISGNGTDWVLQHDDPVNDRIGRRCFDRLYEIDKDFKGSRTLYVKYSLYAGDPGRSAGDNRGATLREFRLEGLTAEEVASHKEWQGNPSSTASLGGSILTVSSIEPFFRAESGKMISGGEIKDSTGKSYPLVLVQEDGRGKWVHVNFPALFRFKNADGTEDWANWQGRFGLLNAIVKTYAGKSLKDYMSVYTAKGEGCILAVRPMELGPPETLKKCKIQVKADHPKTVVFETFDKKLEVGPFVSATSGGISFETDMSADFAAKLWVTKPYGKPVMLYADGSFKHVARLDDGIYDAKRKTLKLTFAEKAYVSSPYMPKEAVAENGKKLNFSYDSKKHLITIDGTGDVSRITIRF